MEILNHAFVSKCMYICTTYAYYIILVIRKINVIHIKVAPIEGFIT